VFATIPIGTEESMSLELLKPAIAALKIRALPTGRAVVFALQLQSLKAQSTPTRKFQGVYLRYEISSKSMCHLPHFKY
jgi:hypothetical protein